ncbi:MULTISPECIES: hypothetical protein [Halorussus]|uniref:hypothetical protein n=1 Tax=Halorussus TaxID=1070314 RepID=UPI00209FAF76|nr:hypothetical protein [Halorussus vallis]USZ74396.1 hypothetical protein NGM07_13185 [Halorussus vallis]
MFPARSDVVDLETGPRVVSLFPIAFGDDCGATVSVEWVATATPERPAELRATLTNRNEFRAKFRTRSLPPFHGVCSSRLRERAGASATVYLAPTADHPLVDERTSYERGDDGYWHAAEVPPEQPASLWLDPEESITGEYHLLCHADTEGFPTGRYRFGGSDGGFSISVWDADAPGPAEGSAFEGVALPPLPRDAGTAWHHEADATTETYLRPTVEEAVIPGRLDFELVNRSHDQVEGNPLEWHLYKLRGGEWYRIAPPETPQPLSHLSPGDTKPYTLRVFRGDPVPCDRGYDVGHLGGGRYALEVGTWGSAVRAVAFDLLGDPVEVTPGDALTAVERDGDSLLATAERGDAGGEHSRLAKYTLARVDSVPADADPQRLVAEQVLRRDQLRDALGLLDRYDARSVTIAEYDSTRPPFGFRESGFVEYRGDVYEITTEAEE